MLLPSLSSLEICTNFICDFSTLRKCSFSKRLAKLLLSYYYNIQIKTFLICLKVIQRPNSVINEIMLNTNSL